MHAPMEPLYRSKASRWYLFAMLGVFFVFLGIFLPHTRYYPYYIDDNFKFHEALKIAKEPASAWAPDDVDRRRPLSLYCLYLESLFFGFRPWPYFVVLLCLHFLNAILVGRVCRLLGGDPPAQTLSSLLFFCSSSFYQVLIFITGTLRVLSLSFFLLAIIAWIHFLRTPKIPTLVKTVCLLSLSLICNEDGLTFPFVALLLSWIIVPEKEKRKVIYRMAVPCLFLINFILVFCLTATFFTSRKNFTPLSGSFHPIQKLLGLAKMFLVPLLLPPRGLLGATPFPDGILRLLPALLVIVLCLVFLGKKASWRETQKSFKGPFIFACLGWIAITIAPFLLHPLSLEHTSRYLYYPSVGFSILLATFLVQGIDVVRSVQPRYVLLFCLPVLLYSLFLNAISTVYHYQRYVLWSAQSNCQYYDEVKSTFAEASLKRTVVQ